MAEDWHIPPWQVEDDTSELWLERWRVWRDEKAAAEPRPKKSEGN